MASRLNKRQVGLLGEEIAAGKIREMGLQIVSRNYRCRHGEIDIIARDGHDLVFVEVKTRKSFLCGAPEEAVNYQKQAKLRQLARHYMAMAGLQTGAWRVRFDVYSVYLDEENRLQRIDVFENCL